MCAAPRSSSTFIRRGGAEFEWLPIRNGIIVADEGHVRCDARTCVRCRREGGAKRQGQGLLDATDVNVRETTWGGRQIRWSSIAMAVSVQICELGVGAEKGSTAIPLFTVALSHKEPTSLRGWRDA